MKKFFYVFFNIIIFTVLIVSPFFVVYKLDSKANVEKKENIIVSLWHVDSYAGSSSLFSFLEKQGVNYNKNNKNIFVINKKVTENELINALAAGDLPDAVSFSSNVGSSLVTVLQDFERDYPVRADIKRAGEANGAIKAGPYAMSSYTVISKEQLSAEKTLFNQGEETAKGKKTYSAAVSTGSMALSSLISREEKVISDLSLTESELALSLFKTGGAKNLIGTNKDVVNLINTYSETFYTEANSYFTDMVQFLGIINSEKQTEIEGFIDYLLSTAAQERLSGYNAYNVIGKSFYTQSILRDIETSINKSKKTISVFLAPEKKNALSNLFKQYLNSSGVIDEINKYLI